MKKMNKITLKKILLYGIIVLGFALVITSVILPFSTTELSVAKFISLFVGFLLVFVGGIRMSLLKTQEQAFIDDSRRHTQHTFNSLNEQVRQMGSSAPIITALKNRRPDNTAIRPDDTFFFDYINQVVAFDPESKISQSIIADRVGRNPAGSSLNHPPKKEKEATVKETKPVEPPVNRPVMTAIEQLEIPE